MSWAAPWTRMRPRRARHEIGVAPARHGGARAFDKRHPKRSGTAFGVAIDAAYAVLRFRGHWAARPVGCLRPRRAPFSMSSRIDHETGVVTITAPVYATMPVGTHFFVVGSLADAGHDRAFHDWAARLLLSRAGNPRHEGVTVKPPEGALPEAIAHGLVHESLIEEPRAV